MMQREAYPQSLVSVSPTTLDPVKSLPDHLAVNRKEHALPNGMDCLDCQARNCSRAARFNGSVKRFDRS